jgi:hypothetical protein
MKIAQHGAPDKGNYISTPWPRAVWTQGSGFGADGSFYISLATTQQTLALGASYSSELKNPRSNNQPQFTFVNSLDNNFNALGTLFVFGGGHPGPGSGWYSLQGPDMLPDSALLEIVGSSIMDQGYDYSDNGTAIKMEYWQHGVMLTLDFDDCGSLGGNPDNDFKDKEILLWLPIIYNTDFKNAQVIQQLPYNGNLIAFE